MPQIAELVAVCHKVYQKEFVSATDGNLSIRIGFNRFAITRSGINKGDITEKDIIIIDSLGNKIEGLGAPSSESRIHLVAYNNRPGINAVIHCHPVFSTAFATSKISLTKPVFPEVILTIGPVPICNYGTPSTEALPESMLPFIKNSWALLLQNHGAVTFGENLSQAYNRMEKLEHSAKTLFVAKLLGGEIVLTEKNVEKLYEIAETTYGIQLKPKDTQYNNSSNANIGPSSESEKYNHSFMELIEERLRARAGNPPSNNLVGKKYYPKPAANVNCPKPEISEIIKKFNR